MGTEINNPGIAMPAIYHRSNAEIEGVWLWDQKALMKLDEILDRAQLELERARSEEIESEVERQLTARQGDEPQREKVRGRVERSYEFRSNSRKITIEFASGKKMAVEKFSEAFARPDIQNDIPTQFTANMKIGSGAVTIRGGASSFSKGRTSIDVTPVESQASPEIFLGLKDWAEETSQPAWQKMWSRANGVQWGILALIFMVSSVLMLGLETNKHVLRAEAAKLLEGGLNNDEQRRAQELLLALAIDYNPPTAQPRRFSTGKWLWINGVALALAVLLSFPPKTTLAIGHGKTLLERQRGWLGICSFLIVSVLILGIGVSLAGSAIYDLLTKS